MDGDRFRALYDYHVWANHRVWDYAMQLSDEQFAQPVAHSVGSIHEQLVHLMSAEYIWFSRLKGTSPTAVLTTGDYPNRVAVRVLWDQLEADARAFLATLDDAQLESEVEYRRTSGEPMRDPVWVIVTQLVNHGTDHRAQIMAQLNTYGVKTGAQDFIVFMREKSRQ
jgi:uncharacterized damage-inducible protein DinB